MWYNRSFNLILALLPRANPVKKENYWHSVHVQKKIREITVQMFLNLPSTYFYYSYDSLLSTAHKNSAI